MNNYEMIDMWNQPFTINPNNFKFKSLSSWSANTAVGCAHGCRFCYVPEVSAIKQAAALKKYGVNDPDAQWGDYALLRTWDAGKFHASLERAKSTPADKLNADGNRAIMYCTTTDPYQVVKDKKFMGRAETMVRNSLEIIRDNSDLNVRILTRGPLAREHFDLFKSFGNRLLFGMSLPTLNDKLCQIYEPHAPGPKIRLKTLQAAREAGLNVYVAMAPTYPECDEADLRRTLEAIRDLQPVTVFHEPINIRAKNVERIAQYAKTLGLPVRSEVFADNNSWREYALDQLLTVQRLATEIGLQDCLHLWPDQSLKSQPEFLNLRRVIRERDGLPGSKEQDLACYNDEYLPWLQAWWKRISEWPGQRRNEWKPPAIINPFA